MINTILNEFEQLSEADQKECYDKIFTFLTKSKEEKAEKKEN